MTDLKKYAVPAILTASFLLRAGYALYTGGAFIYPDEGVYNNLALSMLSGPDWSGLFHNREPLYPAMIWLTYKITGPFPLAVKLLQAALSVYGVFLLHRTSRGLFGPKAAFLTLLISAFYPFSIFYDARLLRESLLAFLGIAVLHVSLKPGAGPRRLIAASALAGLAAMAKTIFLFYWAPFAAAALLLRRVSPAAALACAGAFTLAVAPLAIANHSDTGKFFLCRGQIFALYTPLVSAKEVHGTPGEEAYWQKNPVYVEGMALPEAERDAYFMARVKEEIQTRPLNFADRTLWRFLKLWRLYPNRVPEYSAGNWLLLSAISLMSDGWLIPLGFWAAFALRGRWRELYPVYIYLASFTMIYSLSWSQIRYRLPLMPALILLAAPLAVKILAKAGVNVPGDTPEGVMEKL
ncbi:MAG TPA: glycosyltransferase family 39 protein [Elusimicrobiales bacterium]|nr:glycosyltransferase family 39 protein [Elusimicrobiales bacterium]